MASRRRQEREQEQDPHRSRRLRIQEPDNGTHRFEVGEKDLEAFSLCLILGTLEAMRSGAWPMEAGIWTLGRPIFWEPLAAAGVSKEVIEAIQVSDELGAIDELCGRPAAEETIDKVIAVVRKRLAELPDRTWYAFWSGGPGA